MLFLANKLLQRLLKCMYNIGGLPSTVEALPSTLLSGVLAILGHCRAHVWKYNSNSQRVVLVRFSITSPIDYVAAFGYIS